MVPRYERYICVYSFDYITLINPVKPILFMKLILKNNYKSLFYIL